MKLLGLIVLFALMTTQLAWCETFQIGATIPRIIGVNYFPESADIAPSNTQKQAAIDTQIVMREGQKVVLKTRVVK